jgi:hypothetical protein
MGRRVSAVAGAVAFADVRDLVAAALEPQVEGDPPVHVELVDALYPPALMVEWNDPAMQASAGVRTVGACAWTARLRVRCVGSRVEPGPGYRMIEQLVTYVVARLDVDAYPWSLDGLTGPRVFNIAKVDYLAADVNYTAPITI